MSIIYIKSDNTEKKISFNPPALLSSLLGDFSVPTPCGGNHTCGKCKVKATGALSKLTADELKLLTKDEAENGVRLSCAVFAEGDCEVILSEAKADHSTVLLEGNAGKLNSEGYSIACDIGTTTIAAYLYHDGELINSIGEQNSEGRFGADVITRIGAGTPDLIHKTVLAQLSEMFKKCTKGHAPANDVKSIVITGNTTMLHFLTGYDPAGIAVYPFTPKSLFDMQMKASELFPEFEEASLYLPPCISSYVGADLLCAVTASGMCEENGVSLLADIGTNGEMAIYKDGRLYTCSTAAGPALEGATIKMGTVAKEGAITRVYFENDEMKYDTIGGAKPVGICGSGLISLMALLVKSGIVDESGMIDEECGEMSRFISEDEDGSLVNIGDSGIVLTQKDIRQFQLAKSAICAGILTLLNECKITAEDVQSFYICGGFGSYIDIDAAAATGLIPTAFKAKAKALGNAAGTGAAMLNDGGARERAKEIADKASDLELSTNEFFMEQYIERMYFSEI